LYLAIGQTHPRTDFSGSQIMAVTTRLSFEDLPILFVINTAFKSRIYTFFKSTRFHANLEVKRKSRNTFLKSYF
jgi:hypothetical protein